MVGATVRAMLPLILAAPASAQQPVNPAQLRLRQLADMQHATSRVVVIEPPAPIVNLFERAEQGIERRDWKFAIDSLQRVIDDPQDSLVPRPNGAAESGALYESGRRRAMRRLAELPPEGLRAYRLLFDGKAKGLLERAATAHDESMLRTVVDRYVLTRYGDDAADLLAAWALDENRPGAALSALTELVELVPDFDVPRRVVVAKMAAAQIMLGRRRDAELTIESYVASAPTDDLPAWLSSMAIDDAAAVALRGGAPDDATEPDTGAPTATTSLDRRGWMPAVTPTLLAPSPWRFDLDGGSSVGWRRVQEDDPADPVEWPARRAVIGPDRLYVRRGEGCAALDVDDLSVVWEWPPPPPARNRLGGSITEADSTHRDEVGRSISLAADLTLLVVRSGAGSPRAAADGVAIVPRNAPRRSVDVSLNDHSPTRIVALDGTTGTVRWERGRTFDPNDPLGDVEFRSAPVLIDERLWVPFIEQRDLYVGLLAPEDGSLTRRILLGTLPPARSADRPLLELAAADGIVYVPSEEGVLFALDADGAALRWAARYEPKSSAGSDAASARRVHRRSARSVHLPTNDVQPDRMPSAPIVIGGIVLTVPTDGGELLAFSAATGTFLWSTPVDNSAYPIAARGERVWIGGRTVSCRSLGDGAAVWSTGIDGVPSGRAVLSGDALLIPTGEGLVSLDPASGAPLDRSSLAESEAPLGNLLCAAAAMYSVDAASVRRFPDLDGPYDAARLAHASDPSDLRAALRLAWLEHLRDDPREALAALDDIPTSELELDRGRASAVAHLKVESLRALALRGEGDERIALLDRALRAARHDSDRLRCQLDIAQEHAARGRRVEAGRALVELALSPARDSDQPPDHDIDMNVFCRVQRRFAEVATAMTPDERARFSAQLDDHVARAIDALGDDATAGEAARALGALSDLPVPSALRIRALTALADWHGRHRRYERAEQFLLSGLRLDSTADDGFSLIERIHNLYRDMGAPIASPVDGLIGRFVDRHGSEPAPGAVARAGAAPHPDSVDGAGPTVAAMVDALGREPPQPGEPVETESTVGARYGLTAQSAPAWSIRAPSGQQRPTTEAPFDATGDLKRSLDAAPRLGPPRLVNFSDPGVAAGDDRVIFHGANDVLFGQRAGTGELLWYTSLRLPETFSGSSGARQGTSLTGRRTALVDGNTVVINGRFGLFGIGRISGRRLWVRPHEFIAQPGEDAARDGLMAVHDGMIAAMPRSDRLALMRVRDGSTVWERDLRGEPVAEVRIGESSVMTVDRLLQRVHLFDRMDGEPIRRLRFQQPDLEGGPIRLIDTGGVVCGPDGASPLHELRAVDLATGEDAWRVQLNKPIRQLFEPAPGFVGVGMSGGGVRIIGSATGDVVVAHEIGGGGAVTDGVLLDGMLIVRVDTARNNRPPQELAAIDITTGERIWRRDDLIGDADFLRSLNMDDGAAPALVELPGQGGNRHTRVGLVIVDVRTGANRGVTVDLELTRSRVQFNGDFALAPGAVVIGTTTGVEAYRTEPMSDAKGNNF